MLICASENSSFGVKTYLKSEPLCCATWEQALIDPSFGYLWINLTYLAFILYLYFNIQPSIFNEIETSQPYPWLRFGIMYLKIVEKYYFQEEYLVVDQGNQNIIFRRNIW